MDATQLTWLIVGIVVVLVIIAIVVFLVMRQRSGAAVEANRRKADEIRSRAQETELEAKTREAEAASRAAEAQRAQAAAQQAQVDAERLEREAGERQSGVQDIREDAAEQYRRADKVDPDVDVDKDGTRRDDATGRHADDTRRGTDPDIAARPVDNPDAPRH